VAAGVRADAEEADDKEADGEEADLEEADGEEADGHSVKRRPATVRFDSWNGGLIDRAARAGYSLSPSEPRAMSTSRH